MYLPIFEEKSNSNSRFTSTANLITLMKILHNLNSAISNFWTNVLAKQNEIKVWQKSDRKGNIYWLIFDPITGYHSSFSNEKEVRIWLEERYNSHFNR